MRECPFCKAQIEDNARFCLYCMKPLTEKETIPPQKKDMRWLFVVAGVAMAIVVVLLLPDRKPVKPQAPSADIGGATVATTTQTETPTAEPVQESTGESTAEPPSTEDTVTSPTEIPASATGTVETKPTKPVTKGTDDTRAPATIPVAPGTKTTTGYTAAATGPATLPVTTKPAAKATTAPTTKPATKTTTTPTSEPTTKPTTNPTTAPTTKPTTVPTTPPPATGDVSKLPRYTWEHPYTSSLFKYRAAVQADVLGLDYSVTGNDIVITRIEIQDETGWLQIPSYINGKRVVALDTATFAEGIAELIYLPKTLLALHDDVFGNDLPQYLYVSGEVLAMGENAEPNVEIYTTKTCVNQHGEKFSNLSYWQEWSAQTYAYRTALPSDVGDSGYKNTAGDIVITDVDMPNEDYIYDIPAYIDGKKVVAIGPWALSNTCAVAIYVPATVKCVGIGAFNYCMYGANIYFRGDSIYAASSPFDLDSRVTLHCSATCRNGNKGYYKDLAKGYGVTWKKWNG